MEATLLEIQASNRSRKITLCGMAVCVVLVAAMSLYVLHQIKDMIKEGKVIVDKIEVIHNKLAETEIKQTLHKEKVDKLVDLAKKTASSPEVAKELQRIQKLDAPTPKNLERAVKKIRDKPANGIFMSSGSVYDKGDGDGNSGD